jgi:hypothetical protein
MGEVRREIRKGRNFDNDVGRLASWIGSGLLQTWRVRGEAE